MSRAYMDIARAPKHCKRRSNVPLVFAAIVGDSCATLSLWRKRVRYRRALAQMGERELADIGVSWPQIVEEAEKPFWRA